MSYGSKKQEKELGQSNLFDLAAGGDSENSDVALDIAIENDYEDKEKLGFEASLLGIYVSARPLDKYEDIISQLTSSNLHDLQDLQGSGKRDMIIAGMITTRKNILTKKATKCVSLN